MTVEPEAFSNDQWVAYNTAWINALMLSIFGLSLFVGGMYWGMEGISSAIVGTENGIMIVNGGMGIGAIFGPFISAIGITILTFVQYPANKATRIKDRAMGTKYLNEDWS